MEKEETKESSLISKDSDKKKFYNLLLAILIVATIVAALFGPINYKYEGYIDIGGYQEMYWKWLIIPLSAIGLGKKFKMYQLKSKINIILGTIVFVYLVIGGIFYYCPVKKYDYQKIDEFNNITGLKLEEKGKASYINIKSFLNDRAKNYKIIETKIKNKYLPTIRMQINSNDNWLLLDEIDPSLKIYLPRMDTNDKIYVSVYNATNNTYNTIPEETGDYEIYLITFNYSKAKLDIGAYNYSYKKRKSN